MMSRYVTNAFGVFEKYLQNNMSTFLAPTTHASNILQPVRYMSKHWNPKFKKERKQKLLTLEEMKKHMELDPDMRDYYIAKYGFPLHHLPPEVPFLITCSTQVLDPYVPPEGDGKYSIMTKEGINQQMTRAKKMATSLNAMRKLRSNDINFDKKEFLEDAMEIYKKAHVLLSEKNYKDLIDYVTEMAYPKMIYGTKLKTIRWKLIKYLEPVRIVQARYASESMQQSIFAQITIRFHTQQILSIYDRFGRLIQGSDIVAKDVLEYIVFEKVPSFKHSKWRIHDKIIPSWVPKEQPVEKTYQLRE